MQEAASKKGGAASGRSTDRRAPHRAEGDVLLDVGCLDESSPLRARKAELKGGFIKGQWTKEEDEMVMKYVEKYGTKQWARIAQILPGRKGKQCRFVSALLAFPSLSYLTSLHIVRDVSGDILIA
jgi:hypothetical protein